jgi:hypothetical protein
MVGDFSEITVWNRSNREIMSAVLLRRLRVAGVLMLGYLRRWYFVLYLSYRSVCLLERSTLRPWIHAC